MSEAVSLEYIVDQLENSLNTYLLKNKTYQDIQNALDRGQTINAQLLQRLLTQCGRDLKRDVKFASSVLCIMSTILKLKLEEYSPPPDLVPSALALVHFMKAVSQKEQADTLSAQSFETLLSYPDHVLVTLAINHRADLIQIIDRYTCRVTDADEMPFKVADQFAFTLLARLLKILPFQTKTGFAEEGLVLWFAKIIPNAMKMVTDMENIEVLEQLADALVSIDYSENPHWNLILESISHSKKYPSIIRNLLEEENDNWCRLWIIFIKLLKNQITKNSSSSGSPIASLLPLVETAFKNGPKMRCQAFLCWNVLIDNFASELNESYSDKRTKLLIVPLKSNNARVEETALAKMNTWWHLIRQFHCIMDKFTDVILIPFIHFCFGRINLSGKITYSSGQFSDSMKIQCLQILVEIGGHVDCDGCVSIPLLKGKLISPKILVEYWKDWVHCLRSAIKIAASTTDTDNEVMARRVTCLWKAFALTIAELPENNIRKDLFSEFLAIVPLFLQDCVKNYQLASIVFDVLITSLFEDVDEFKHILRTNEEKGPMYTVVLILANQCLHNFYRRRDANVLKDKLKSVTNFIVDDSLCLTDKVVDTLFNNLEADDNTLILWAALAESVCESQYELSNEKLWNLIMWPLESIETFTNVRSSLALSSWVTLYKVAFPKLGDSVTGHITRCLSDRNDVMMSPTNFLLSAALTVLKSKLVTGNAIGIVAESKLLVTILNKVNDYQSIEKSFPTLVDALCLMLHSLPEDLDVLLTEYVFTVVKVMLKLATQVLQTKNENVKDVLIFNENLLKPLEDLFKKKPSNLKLKNEIVNQIIDCFKLVENDSSSYKSIRSILKTCMSLGVEHGIEVIDKIRDVLHFDKNYYDCNTDAPNVIPLKQNVASNNFTTPNDKSTRKKSSKKEASIVNTLKVNGEEFVVVKSNWTFNPKKLTENQKEKLKRKREDIPALYQDLSQSQDEFKLSTWNTESQDTTTTSCSNSKSTSKHGTENVSLILKSIPNSSSIVPQIIDNFLSNNTSTIIEKDNTNVANDKTNVQHALSIKNTKSPRMALKDRVFKNVKNLIEKSRIQQTNDRIGSEDLNQTLNENVLRTPPSKTKITSLLVNSAPPKIISERPSRVIKKPKKFEDTEIFAVKKRRRSLYDSQPSSEESSHSAKNVMEETGEDHCSTIEVVIHEPKLRNNEKQDLQCSETSVTDGNTNVPDILVKNIDVTQNGEFNGMTVNIHSVDNMECDGNRDIDMTFNSHSVQDEVAGALKNVSIEGVSSPQPTNKENLKVQEVKNLKSTNKDVSMMVKEGFSTPESSNKDISMDVNTAVSMPKSINKKNSMNVDENVSAPSPKFLKKKISKRLNEEVSTEISMTVKEGVLRFRPTNKDISLIVKKPDSSRKSTNKKNNMNVSAAVSTPKSTNKKISMDMNTAVSTPKSKNKEIRMNVDEVSAPKSINKKIIENLNEGVSTPKSANQEVSIKVKEGVLTLKPTNKDISLIVKKGVPSRKSTNKEISMNVIAGVSTSLSTNKEISIDVNKAVSMPKSKSKEISTNIADKVSAPKSINTKMCKDLNEGVTIPKSTNKEISMDVNEGGSKNKEIDEKKLLVKKKKYNNSIERQLLIDTVEGHPLLQVQSEFGNRITRKNHLRCASSVRKKSLVEKLNNAKSEMKSNVKYPKKINEIDELSKKKSGSEIIEASEERLSASSEDLPQSEDIIESSQDSSVTTISVKSAKHILNKIPFVKLSNCISEDTIETRPNTGTKNILDDFASDVIPLSDTVLSDQGNKEDIELPKNKTLEGERAETDFTENMDTLPFEDKESSGEVFTINDDETPIMINTEDTYPGPDTQETAEADTEPMDILYETSNIQETIINEKADTSLSVHENDTCNTKGNHKTADDLSIVNNKDTSTFSVTSDVTAALTVDSSGTCSPLKDNAKRKNEFLNDTLEISPIKTMSPVIENKSPSLETSSDYVVIKLTSPVHSNGEPFEKCDSPEIFTEDKVSPDKRDLSPPRTNIVTNNGSPSSSLSLKKNRNQVRSNGRAAQMLGLCAPDKLKSMMNSERPADSQEYKKSSASNTPARRNLKMLYNLSVEDNVNTVENEDSEQFLQFKKTLPIVDSSPSGPILKRKLGDMADEATTSPASKRKRVSFHDPPVSTTIAVQKYIEPGIIRSPQSSSFKRLERQLRGLTAVKSPRNLENVFKLDSALTRTVESFTEEPIVTTIDDTELSSIEQTPAVEVVKTSDLNDTDPICPLLLDCKDPIDNIATELSSPAMRELLVMELKGRVETIADLAKMTELEVNRLCIKAPKINITKTVLTEYASKVAKTQEKLNDIININIEEPVTEPETPKISVEVQTSEVLSKDSEIQTDVVSVTVADTQTDAKETSHTSIQTNESGYKSTKDVVTSCLSERSDFIEQLSDQLKESAVLLVADKLSFNASVDLLLKKMTTSNSAIALNRVLEYQQGIHYGHSCPMNEETKNRTLSLLQDFVCDRFESRDLILFCMQLLQKVHDKSP